MSESTVEKCMECLDRDMPGYPYRWLLIGSVGDHVCSDCGKKWTVLPSRPPSQTEHHERVTGIIPGVTPDIGHKVSDGEGHTGYGKTRSEAEEALKVARENNVETAEKDTRPIIGSILPGHVLGKKLKDDEEAK